MNPSENVTSVPRVTVVVPMYNSERHVRETLNSIAAQTLKDLEVIVIDDGSTDSSIPIVTEMAARDPRFRLITPPRHGSAGAARNVGLDLARGEYLAFLDADDLFAPTMLQKLYEKARADDADIVMTAFRSFSDATGKREPLGRRGRLHAHLLPKATPFAPAEISDHIFTAPHTTVWNKIFRTAFVREEGLRFETVHRSNDAYFNMMALTVASRLSYVNEPLVSYRASNANSLQGSQADEDFSWADASRAVVAELTRRGIYGTFRRAMLQRVATRSFDRLSKAATATAFAEMYETVRFSIFPEFELDTAEREDFPDPAVADRVDDFLRLPMTEWLLENPTAASVRLRASQGFTELDPGVADVEQDPPSDDGPTAPDRLADEAPASPAAHGSLADRSIDVSVILTVAASSTSELLAECLTSALSQPSLEIEAICVLDRPSSDAREQVEAMASSDARVVVLESEALGESSARNIGLAAARGRYVTHLHSRDRWLNGSMTGVVGTADAERADVVVFDATTFLGGAEPDLAADAASASALASPVTRPGVALLPEVRWSRHLREHAGTVLTRRDHLLSAGLTFSDGISPDNGAYVLQLLAISDRVTRTRVSAYARRSAGVRRDDHDVEGALTKVASLQSARRSGTLHPAAAALVNALLGDAVTYALERLKGDSQNTKRTFRRGAGSSRLSVTRRSLEQLRAKEVRDVRR